MAKDHKIEAVFVIERETAVFLAIPSKSGEGRYLVAAALVKGKIVIAHDCPASKVRKPCWHNDSAIKMLQTVFWWNRELDNAEVIHIYRKVNMTEEWRQIQIPEKFGEDPHEQQRNKHTA